MNVGLNKHSFFFFKVLFPSIPTEAVQAVILENGQEEVEAESGKGLTMLPSSLLHSESTEMGSSPRRHYRLYWPLMVFVLQRQYVVFIRQWKFVHAYSIYAFE